MLDRKQQERQVVIAEQTQARGREPDRVRQPTSTISSS
jgi:hypothetical protein